MPSPFKLRRRHALQLLAGASGGALLHACGGAQQNPSADSPVSSGGQMQMTMGTVPWIGQVPLYIAQEKGFYAESGLDLTLRNFGSSGEYMSAFASGNVDGLSPASTEAVTLKAQGEDFKIVLIQDNSVGSDGILARNNIASIAEFKGKKVAVDTAGVSYFFLLQVLQEAGLSKDDITPIDMDPGAAAAALISNNVDIAVSYFPYLEQAAKEAENSRIIYDSAKMPTAIIDLYLFHTDYIAANPEAVQAFVNGTLKGLQFLQDNPAEGAEISAAAIEIPPEEVTDSLTGVTLPDKATNLEMLANTESDLYVGKSLEELGSFLATEGQIDAKPADVSSMIDP
ncbi:MAG: ABC transporter substrate-binding protein, partial [Cyanobacteria bacterium J06598_3]